MNTNTKDRKVFGMFRNIIRRVLYVIGLLLPLGVMAQLHVFEAPAGVATNNSFTVQVRLAAEKQWQQVTSYNVKVNKMEDLRSTIEDASLAYFSTTGNVEVAVRLNEGTLHTARIRPLSYGIKPKIKGNTIYFKIDKPCNLTVEMNGDIFHNLHLFADPIYESVDSLSKNLIYLKPGVHKLKDG